MLAWSGALVGAVAIAHPAASARAQSLTPRPVVGSPGIRASGGADDLDSLVARALAVNPSVTAAASRLEATRHRVAPAGARPDPMLMAGIQNLPLGRERQLVSADGVPTGTGGPDPMTMRMIGVGQSIPYPGKLALRRRTAEGEVSAAEASLAAAKRRVAYEVKAAYYELVFLDRALDVVERNQGVLVSFIKVTETRYGVGIAGQQDVLKAHVEASRLAETAVSLTEQHRASLARLNAVLNRPSETPLPRPAIPAPVTRAAVADSGHEIRFVSAALGARVANSPLPPLAELQDMAVRESPELREHEAMITAQTARVELARKEVLPDFDLSIQYGQRDGRPDMVTATVSVPVPLQRRRKQDELVNAAGAELTALEAEHRGSVNEIRAEVARLVSELERERSHLALYVKALLPQARASVSSSVASYQVSRVEFLTVLDNQATVFNYETEYFRVLSDFAKHVAELERVVGKEIL
ncbi:MAG: TolC family protein [Gemmatimonadota bacterium]|nr:TolC family protein [Gemmatimonadota bacterium]